MSNDLDKVGPGGAQYALLCREDGGVLDDLFTYWLEPTRRRALPHRRERVERRLGLRLVREAGARAADGVEVIDRSADYAMLALQGPQAIALIEPLLEEGEVPGRFRHDRARSWPARRRSSAAPATRARTASSCCSRPATRDAVWDALVAAGATPAGLGARDTLRLEVCYPLYGNDLSAERTPIEAGLGWACALDKDFIGAERLREQAEQGTAEKLAPFVFTGPGIPRAGLRRAGTAASRSASSQAVPSRPAWRSGSGWPTCARPRRARHRARGRRARQAAPGARRVEAPLQEGGLTAWPSRRPESYPEDLLYHPEHDWARIEGDEATFGITWYAQDALGEVVFFDPPERRHDRSARTSPTPRSSR